MILRLDALKKSTTKHELAALLGIKTSVLTYSLYKLKPATQYTRFEIPKKSGGHRVIFSPTEKLKSLQSSLSVLLLDCIDEINQEKGYAYKPTLSHGFVRKRSIITNAMMHLNQQNVLNIDLEDFFDSFNFGRVRGFFIKNRHFELDPHIATVIAQIACYDNKLPQGSPCSPVITNLITHSLDIRLASLAKKHSCIYTRYADDMTFSTREALFPRQIMREEGGEYIASKKLKNEIRHAGFSINEKKTRIQYKDSRQDVTGLIVNQKPNVKKEYWRTVKSQCNSLFHTGVFFTKKTASRVMVGNLNTLNGQLDFIDQVDRFNRKRQKPHLNHSYALSKYGHKTWPLLSGREKTFSRFLYYRLFYGNTKPTILCEGKTDNVYLKSAINELAHDYPQLATPKTLSEAYELLVRFVEYSTRTRFLLGLYGGTSYINYFISRFGANYKFYKAPQPTQPVIIVLDNDSGFTGKKDTGIAGKLKKIDSAKAYPTSLAKHDFHNADFIHVLHNLYVVLTPLGDKIETAIEDLFDDAIRKTKVSGKIFNPCDKRDNEKEYGKEIFANKVIKAQKQTIDFNGLKPLLDRITKALEHYNSTKHA